MKKVLKWTGIVLVFLLIVLGAFGMYCSYKADARMARKFAVEPVVFTIPTDSVTIQNGGHWVNTLCAYCHGENLAGKLYSDSPGFGQFYSSNLTSGKGGVGSFYTDKDWIRSIRHGVAPDGRGLFTMPSSDYNNLSAADVGAIIGYLKTLPHVDNIGKGIELQIIGKILLTLGALDGIISAEVIDHSLPPPSSVAPEIAGKFGDYLVKFMGCRTCHGRELNGMQPPMPGAPFAPDLTPGGNLAKWSPEKFIASMRTGVTPEGKSLNSKFMPVSVIGKMTDDELKAIFVYLISLPKTTEPAKKS